MSKQAMDIDHLGPALIDQLVSANALDSPADFYRLTVEQLMKLERMAEKSATNVYDSIQNSKSRPLFALINALGIPQVGRETAILLAQHYFSMDRLVAATVDNLTEIEGIGVKMAEGIVGFFGEVENQNLLTDLKALGLTLESDSVPYDTAEMNPEHPFFGKSFVLTGTLPTLTREQAEAIIRQYGGKIVGSVSKKTNYLLLGDNPGSKYDKAVKLNIPVLEEADFTRLGHPAKDEAS